MANKTQLVTCRKWEQAQIEAYLTDVEVGARIDLEPLIDALVSEIGNPATMMTQNQLKTRLAQAFQAVLFELRTSTKHVV